MDKTSTQENSNCQIFESYTVLENGIKLTFSLSTALKNNTLSQEYLTIWHFTEVFSLHRRRLGSSSIEQLDLIFSNKNNTVIHF